MQCSGTALVRKGKDVLHLFFVCFASDEGEKKLERNSATKGRGRKVNSAKCTYAKKKKKTHVYDAVKGANKSCAL